MLFPKLENFNLESFIDHFNSNMSSILDKYVPLKIVTVKPHTFNPLFNSCLRSEKGKRRQLKRTSRKTGNESNRLAYKKQCHFYNSIVKKLNQIISHLFLKLTQVPQNSGIL